MTHLRDHYTRFKTGAFAFTCLGILLSVLAVAGWSSISTTAVAAIEELLAVRVVLLLIVASLLSIGVVGLVCGRLHPTSGRAKQFLFRQFVAAPALFVTSVVGPMFWSFFGVSLVAYFAEPLQFTTLMLTFLGTLLVLNLAPAIYAHLLAEAPLEKSWRHFRSGRGVSLVLLVGVALMIWQLPFDPKSSTETQSLTCGGV